MWVKCRSIDIALRSEIHELQGQPLNLMPLPVLNFNAAFFPDSGWRLRDRFRPYWTLEEEVEDFRCPAPSWSFFQGMNPGFRIRPTLCSYNVHYRPGSSAIPSRGCREGT